MIIKKIHGSKLFENFSEIRKSTLKGIKNFSAIDLLPKKDLIKIEKISDKLSEEKLIIKDIDYYFSNSIARASKTMSDCRNIRSEKEKKRNF